MKYQIIFSPDLEVNEEVLKAFVEKWNMTEFCKMLAEAEIDEPAGVTYGSSFKEKLMIATTTIILNITANAIYDHVDVKEINNITQLATYQEMDKQ